MSEGQSEQPMTSLAVEVSRHFLVLPYLAPSEPLDVFPSPFSLFLLAAFTGGGGVDKIKNPPKNIPDRQQLIQFGISQKSSKITPP